MSKVGFFLIIVFAILNARGAKLGVMKVHLYRPFPEESFLKVLPKTVKTVSVLDRTKESGSTGEPLYLDVVATLSQAFANGKIASMPKIVGGRYGLSSKEFTPGMVKAVFDNGFAAAGQSDFDAFAVKGRRPSVYRPGSRYIRSTIVQSGRC